MTQQNIFVIKNLYSENIGLTIIDETGSSDNRTLVAYSYIGLCLLEACTTKKSSTIEQYLHRIFQPEYEIGMKFFPEFGDTFYTPLIQKYDDWELDILFSIQNPERWCDNKDAAFSSDDIRFFLDFYECDIVVTDWRNETRIKSAGLVLN